MWYERNLVYWSEKEKETSACWRTTKKRRNLRSTQELLVDIRAERQKGNAAGGEKQTNKQHKNNL